jgi:hypothetical protein
MCHPNHLVQRQHADDAAMLLLPLCVILQEAQHSQLHQQPLLLTPCQAMPAGSTKLGQAVVAPAAGLLSTAQHSTAQQERMQASTAGKHTAQDTESAQIHTLYKSARTLWLCAIKREPQAAVLC